MLCRPVGLQDAFPTIPKHRARASNELKAMHTLGAFPYAVARSAKVRASHARTRKLRPDLVRTVLPGAALRRLLRPQTLIGASAIKLLWLDESRANGETSEVPSRPHKAAAKC
jgi:hypothetical protein